MSFQSMRSNIFSSHSLIGCQKFVSIKGFPDIPPNVKNDLVHFYKAYTPLFSWQRQYWYKLR